MAKVIANIHMDREVFQRIKERAELEKRTFSDVVNKTLIARFPGPKTLKVAKCQKT